MAQCADRFRQTPDLRSPVIRLNPEFKAKYEAMVKAGKPAKVAIVAIMRKLLILANALIRDQRKWAPANP